MIYQNNAILQKEIANNLVNIATKYNLHNNQFQIADIGCGTGFIAQHLNNYGILAQNITQFDINPQMLEYARQFGKTMLWNFNTPPNFTQSFHLIYSSMALQWCTDVNKTIRNIANTLNKGGTFLFAIPTFGSLAQMYRTMGHHFITFPSIESVEATFLQSTRHTANAYETLRNIHTLKLKTHNEHRLTKAAVAQLKKQETDWVIAYFVCQKPL